MYKLKAKLKEEEEEDLQVAQMLTLNCQPSLFIWLPFELGCPPLIKWKRQGLEGNSCCTSLTMGEKDSPINVVSCLNISLSKCMFSA